MGGDDNEALGNIEEMASIVAVDCFVHGADGDECAAFAIL